MDPVLRKFRGGPVKKTTLYVEQIYIFNKPGVAGAVLLTPPLLIERLIHSLNNPFPPDLQNTSTPKTARARELKF